MNLNELNQIAELVRAVFGKQPPFFMIRSFFVQIAALFTAEARKI